MVIVIGVGGLGSMLGCGVFTSVTRTTAKLVRKSTVSSAVTIGHGALAIIRTCLTFKGCGSSIAYKGL